MLKPHSYPDYAEMCHYHPTSPQSHFTRARVCTRATPDGRITLSEMRLITTVNGKRDERMLSGDEEYNATLREYWRILARLRVARCSLSHTSNPING